MNEKHTCDLLLLFDFVLNTSEVICLKVIDFLSGKKENANIEELIIDRFNLFVPAIDFVVFRSASQHFNIFT